VQPRTGWDGQRRSEVEQRSRRRCSSREHPLALLGGQRTQQRVEELADKAEWKLPLLFRAARGQRGEPPLVCLVGRGSEQAALSHPRRRTHDDESPRADRRVPERSRGLSEFGTPLQQFGRRRRGVAAAHELNYPPASGPPQADLDPQIQGGTP
jgi:hypothetical protein